jgi:hypothetical protein
VASVRVGLVSLLKIGLVIAMASGHAEDGDEERQRHQRRPYPFRLLDGVEFTA